MMFIEIKVVFIKHSYHNFFGIFLVTLSDAVLPQEHLLK